MTAFNPEKLFVRMIPPANSAQPINRRKYTLTHSDKTAEIFLDIGYGYNYDAINKTMRDEVLAEWRRTGSGGFNLIGKAYVDGGEFSQEEAERRLNIFKKEMDTAIRAMVYGDQPFLRRYPILLDSPIYIEYESSFPLFQQTFYYGTPGKYLA